LKGEEERIFNSNVRKEISRPAWGGRSARGEWENGKADLKWGKKSARVCELIGRRSSAGKELRRGGTKKKALDISKVIGYEFLFLREGDGRGAGL